MADRAKKISELSAATAAANSDYMLVVTNTAGTAVTKRISFANIATSMPGYSAQVPAGELMFGTGTGFTSSSNLEFSNNAFSSLGNTYLGIYNYGEAVIHLHGAIASNVGCDTPNNFFLGNTSHPWAGIWTTTIRTSELSYGDTDIVLQMAKSTNSYFQAIIQNTSNGTQASTNYNVSADTANSTVNFGEMGINSSGFQDGNSRFGDPLTVYIAAATSNMAVGTYANNPVHVVVNSSNTSTWTFGTDGSLVLPAGPVVFTGTATTRAAVNTQVGAVGSNGSIYLSTAGKMYLRVDGTGVAATDWQRVTTTAVD